MMYQIYMLMAKKNSKDYLLKRLVTKDGLKMTFMKQSYLMKNHWKKDKKYFYKKIQ